MTSPSPTRSDSRRRRSPASRSCNTQRTLTARGLTVRWRSRSWRITSRGAHLMPTFKRVTLGGSEELFRPTRPQVVNDTDDVIREAVDRREKVKEVVLRSIQLTPEEIELVLEAIQTAKYPDRVRAKPPLDKFDSLDALRVKIQGET